MKIKYAWISYVNSAWFHRCRLQSRISNTAAHSAALVSSQNQVWLHQTCASVRLRPRNLLQCRPQHVIQRSENCFANCFAILCQLCSIWRSVRRSVYHTLVVTLVLSRLYYDNAVLVGLPAYQYNCLQSVLNAATQPRLPGNSQE